MTTQLLLYGFACGATAFFVSLLAGYFCWSAVRQAGKPNQAAPESGRLALRYSAIPFVAGVAAGLLPVLFGAPFLRADRFHSPAHQLAISLTFLATLQAYLAVGYWRPTTLDTLDPAAARRSRSRQRRWELLIGIAGAIGLVWSGVGFEVLGLGSHRLVELGFLGKPLTVLWLLIAIWAVRLLDGIDGAAPVLLLTAAVAVLVGSRGNNEFFLTMICIVLIGAATGSLRFHFFPARLPLRGPATAAYGFAFAMLTVMARQKTVAALLLVFPLALIVLLLGGTMLGVLERTLLLPERGQEEPEPADLPADDKRGN